MRERGEKRTVWEMPQARRYDNEIEPELTIRPPKRR